MNNLSTQEYFVLFDRENGMVVDRTEEGFRFEYPGWNLKYYFWFSGDEVDEVIGYLEQTGRKIRKVIVPAATVNDVFTSTGKLESSPVSSKIPYALSII
jgi:hypothetical protein